jgi:hypothetical protein
MNRTASPLSRSIGLWDLVRGFIALAAVVAIGAAFADGHYGLAIAGALFVAVAATFGYKASRVRQTLGGDRSPRDP